MFAVAGARVSASIPSATTSGAGGGRWYDARLLQRRRELAIVEGVVGRREKVPEELARAERARPDLDEPQPRRVRQRARPAQPQHLAARRACTRAGGVRSSAWTYGARPSTPASETKCPATVLSRKRTMGVGPGRPMLAELRAHGRVDRRDTPARRRPGRRTTPPAPSATRPGCARPPARRSGPARSSSRRARRSARPSRSRSRQRRGALPTSGGGPCRRRGRRRRAPPSCGGPPAPVAGRLRAVAADRHRAPVGGAVARLVVEDPAARVLAACLEPRPRARLGRGDGDRGERRERPVDALPCRSEGRCRRRPRSRARSGAGRARPALAAAVAGCGGRPVVFASASARRHDRSVRARRNASEDAGSAPGSSSPRSTSQADRAAGEPRSSCAHSGISVLTKSCRRSSGAGAGARPAGWNPVTTPRYGSAAAVSTPPNASRRCC